MNDGGAAGDRADEADHEVDRVIRREDAEVAHAGPERIERREGDALLEIIFVSQDAALRASARAGGIDDASCVAAFARDECWFGCDAKIFPAMRASEIGVRRCFGDEHCTRREIFELLGWGDGAPEVVLDY